MSVAGGEVHDNLSGRAIDWTDIKVAVVVGVISAVVKVVSVNVPAWRLGSNEALIPCLLTIGYVLYRGRREPAKLDEWGITTPITAWAAGVSLLLLCLGAGGLAAMGLALAGHLSFEPYYVPKMVDYLVAAFPQQFFMCSVGLVTLAKLRPFHGQWRLPLAVGLVFSAAHFWTPALIPGTWIPLQAVLTFPVGFIAAYYFLQFRTILPLTVCHAILYVLLSKWVEANL